MKRIFGLLLCTTFYLASFAQQTAIYTDAQSKFKKAQEFFQKEQFSLALPLLRELKQATVQSDYAGKTLQVQDVDFYLNACMLMMNDPRAEDPAKEYISIVHNQPRAQQLSFYLGQYYFRKSDFRNAAEYFESSNIENLTNDQVVEQKYQLAYAYFNLQRFAQAKPLFDAVRQVKGNQYQLDAQYYFGFISFYDKNYTAALDAFQQVKDHPSYGRVVPFYIINIYYFRGDKEKALQLAEEAIKKGNSYYDLELKQLAGHIYFEKKEFAKALPYLEEYVNKSKKVSKENLYEVSYCYYAAGQLNKAIDGFKQLSGKEDSLSQNAMYLLGDAYLKTNQKTNARNAFAFCAASSSNKQQKEISKFNYAKLSYELGFQDVALKELKNFLNEYPNSTYADEARELLVAVLTNTSNYADAMALLESLPNKSETTKKLYPKILYGRAVEYINDQQTGRAEELLDKILKDPYNAQVLPMTNFWKGEISYRNNKIDDAVKYLNAFNASGNPGQEGSGTKEANYDLGYAYLRKENFNVAQGYFQKVVSKVSLTSNALDQDAYIRTADCIYMNKDYSKAKGMYETVINYSWPNSDYAAFQKAMIVGINNPSEKIKQLTNLQRLYPSSELIGESNMEIANTLIADEKFRDAIPYLNNVLSSTNLSLKPKALLRLGLVYYNIDKNPEALDAYKKLITQYPNSPESDEALQNIKAIYVEMGKPNDYVDFVKSAGKDVNVSEADSLTYAAAELKYTNGDCNGAIDQFDNYLSKFPDGANAVKAHYFKSECYSQRKDWKNALTGYVAVVNKGNSNYLEKAALQAARIYYFELQDYTNAATYYEKLRSVASTTENQLESRRGLLRCTYQLKQYKEAAEVARELLANKGVTSDDKALGSLVTAKNFQLQQQYDQAINNFRQVISLNKGSWAAEARYEIAACYFSLNSLSNAEKSAFEVINKSGSYDYWVTKAYILLGDVYTAQKDYFNAKATYQSIVDNATNPELKNEAQQKLEKVKALEAEGSKIN
ncbi:MAG: tetratricopeptide repeat protein [Sphingobacteriales bacterium]|nr:MAG: tetratricopeptide repeat protein [Sphingobacteriales bacterium]